MNQELEEKVMARTRTIQQQADEIRKMNQLLQKYNIELSNEIERVREDRVMLEDASFEEFTKIFKSESDCYEFLLELKFKSGFKCKKCGHQHCSDGFYKHSKRCLKCNYVETATAHTIFHKLKFPLTKAFYMLYLIYLNKNISVEELAKALPMRVATCFNFKKKILERINRMPRKKKEHGWTSYILD